MWRAQPSFLYFPGNFFEKIPKKPFERVCMIFSDFPFWRNFTQNKNAAVD
jgi:hypothetical protein